MGVWTLSELDAEITRTKTALAEAVKMQTFTESTGAGSVSVSRNSIADLEAHLAYLNRQRVRLQRGGIRVRGATPAAS